MMANSASPPAVGRLLRCLRDCQLFHVRTALRYGTRWGQNERLTRLVRQLERAIDAMQPKSNRRDGVQSERKEQRVLALADHKAIASLQSLLAAIDNAYAPSTAPQPAVESSKNLVVAVAASQMAQATRDCRKSKRNACIWSTESKKTLRLLYWIAQREASHGQEDGAPRGLSPELLRPLLLQWLHDAADKTRQLTASFVLFELFQLHRQAIRSDTEPQSPLLGGGGAVQFIRVLGRIVDQGAVTVKNKERRPTTLGLAALETLVLVCCDAATNLIPSEQPATVDYQKLRAVVDGMQLAVATLIDWHRHTPRRRHLVAASRQLLAFLYSSSALIFTMEAASTTTTRSVQMLLWHWQATAPLLCTRSDAVIHIRDTLGPSQAFEAAMTAIASQFHQLHAVRYDLEVARLRQVCVLLDLVRSTVKTNQGGSVSILANTLPATRWTLVVFLVRLLEPAVNRLDSAVVQLVTDLLRPGLVELDSELGLLETQDEARVVAAHLVGCLQRTADGWVGGLTESKSVGEVEELVVDKAIGWQLPIVKVIQNMSGDEAVDNTAVQVALSLARTLLERLDASTTPEDMKRLWRSQLTPCVLQHLDDQDHVCQRQRLAAVCIPLLDPVGCVFHSLATPLSDQAAASVLSFLLRNSSGQTLDDVTSVVVDMWRFGDSAVTTSSTSRTDTGGVSTAPWWDQYYQIHTTIAPSKTAEQQPGPIADAMMRLAFGPQGWSRRVVDSDTRAAIVRVLLRKIIGSPRDSTLFKIVRELAAADWIQGRVFTALARPLVTHMMHQEVLSEELLTDDSDSSTIAVEALLFARLAPVLVLRVLPREAFCRSRSLPTTCEGGEEDLEHLLEYRKHRDDALQDEDVANNPGQEDQVFASVIKDLFHVTALQILNPLEFKEVKLLAAEILAKLPVDCVLPFTLSHLMAFARDELSNSDSYSSETSRMKLELVDEADDFKPIPQGSCGIVAAKLLVYYLNRVLSEGSLSGHEDPPVTASAVLSVLLLLLHIPCDGDGSDAALLADLQLGCIEWVAHLVSLCDHDDFEELVELLIDWMMTGNKELSGSSPEETTSSQSRLSKLVQDRVRHFTPLIGDQSPLQFRICCCNVLLSALRKLDDKQQVSRSRALSIAQRVPKSFGACKQPEVIAGRLELLFTYLYKFSAVEDADATLRLQVARDSFSTVMPLLASTTNDQVALSGLKVVGALVGRAPEAIASLPPADLQRLSWCLAGLRDRRLSSSVSELSASLLAALFPSSVE